MTGAESPGPLAELIIHVGETRVLRLPSLGSAGYTWQPHADDPVVEVTHEFAPGAAVPGPGASSAELVMICARAAGRTKVHLEQRRPWEGGPPHAATSVSVTVID
ncbi:MAG TPA: protease inhibitor I42 family protein [Jatrophihabitans sp.]|nr:protease inhibitor I42 family protein [Jatrophihabitans sp.]